MNPDLNADLNADKNSSVINDSGIKTPGDWLEYFYGSLFQPQATFIKLRSQPAPQAAALVIVLVNLLEGLRVGQNPLAAPIGVLLGLGGWLILSSILHRLFTICQNQPPIAIANLLTLTGFASSPWIFIASARSLGGMWGFWLAVAVSSWFAVWQIWAAAIALSINPWRLYVLIPMSFAGGLVAIVLFANVTKLLVSFSS
jgi:hypothetical protein